MIPVDIRLAKVKTSFAPGLTFSNLTSVLDVDLGNHISMPWTNQYYSRPFIVQATL